MRGWVGLLAMVAVACGGATKPAVTAAAPRAHDEVAVTTSPVAPSPPLFTGAFRVETMSDAKQSVQLADVMHRIKAHDGAMIWEIGSGSFKVGMWLMSELAKLDPKDADASGRYGVFCRTSGEVTAHWEGSTLVLGSTVSSTGDGAVVRIVKSRRRHDTITDTATQTEHCNASFAATRIDFEVIEKDASGATRVRGRADGGTFELVRAAPIAAVDPSKAFAAP